MKRVVLFKSASEEYERAFSERLYRVDFVEPLRVEPVNAEQLAARLALAEWDALALTSARAVDALARCWDPARFALWNRRRVYTVGDATARAIKQHLGLDSLGADAGNAENLAKIIINEDTPPTKVLFPCGNLSSETLPGLLRTHGIAVETLTVYETKENDQLRDNLMKLNDSENDLCCLVFFSPSGCEYIHRQLQTFSNRLAALPHFAIGNSTAHKIENLGLEIAGVAAKPRAESVMETVDRYFTSQSTS